MKLFGKETLVKLFILHSIQNNMSHKKIVNPEIIHNVLVNMGIWGEITNTMVNSFVKKSNLLNLKNNLS